MLAFDPVQGLQKWSCVTGLLAHVNTPDRCVNGERVPRGERSAGGALDCMCLYLTSHSKKGVHAALVLLTQRADDGSIHVAMCV